MNPIEHPSILEPFRDLEKRGFIEIKYLKIDSVGKVILESLNDYLTNNNDIILCSVMTANNETGIINDIEDIARICRRQGISFHTDMTQALGKIKLPSLENVDFASFSSHKIHGPKGVGGLFISNNVNYFNPLLFGGKQENMYRAGTENVSGIAGFGTACKHVLKNLSSNNLKMRELKDIIEKDLKNLFYKYQIEHEYFSNIISKDWYLPNTLLFGFENLDSKNFINYLYDYGVCVSSGSACSEGTPLPSYVLKEIGYNDTLSSNTIRISISKDTSMEEIHKLLEVVENYFRKGKND